MHAHLGGGGADVDSLPVVVSFTEAIVVDAAVCDGVSGQFRILYAFFQPHALSTAYAIRRDAKSLQFSFSCVRFVFFPFPSVKVNMSSQQPNGLRAMPQWRRTN